MILVSLVLILVAGSVCGIVAIAQISELRSRVNRLESLRTRDAPRDSAVAKSPESAAQPSDPASQPDQAPPTPSAPYSNWDDTGESERRARTAVQRPPPARRTPRAARTPSAFWSNVQENWMVWLGGFCVALAGIFLARYSIEAGLLGPTARISGGITTGLALHIAAEYFRRRTGEANPAFAALAGGGSITLFAALLASLHYYQLLSVPATFALLALVGFATMWLARLHGPALAAIGLVGAYAVPLLVSSGDDRALVAYAYALVVSGSALLLMRYVFRPWLWWGFMTGALGWWLLLLLHEDIDGLRGLYIAALAYMMLAVPQLDWTLKHPVTLPEVRYQLRFMLTGIEAPAEKLLLPGLLLLIVAQCLSIVVEQDYSTSLVLWLPLIIILLRTARFRESILLAPTTLLVLQLCAWLAGRLVAMDDRFEFQILEESNARSFLVYLPALAFTTSCLAYYNLATARYKAIWSSLAVLAPLLCLATGYLLTSHLAVSWAWGAGTFLVAMAYLGIATAALKKQSIESLVVWLFFGGHFALSLAGAMVVSEATLTLVLAAQVISIAWIIRRFELPALGWVLKLLVAVVIVRLTLNPWLASYPTDVHWSLWTFGGAALLCGIGAFVVRSYPLIARWAEGATLHLFVLFVTAEVRYWMHDGVVFEQKITFDEVSIYCVLFGALSLIYYRRSLVSESLARLYQLFSRALGMAALGAYALLVISTLLSSPWAWTAIGETPVFNLTLLAFAAPVALAILHYYFNQPPFRKFTALFSGIATFIYISFQIRHLWQASLRFDQPTSNGELYTYSAVWLLMAIGAILGGAYRFGPYCYRAGMILLALVIGKLFVIDMSGLEGLLRVASFMGLGLSLLAISYLHKKLQGRQMLSDEV